MGIFAKDIGKKHVRKDARDKRSDTSAPVSNHAPCRWQDDSAREHNVNDADEPVKKFLRLVIAVAVCAIIAAAVEVCVFNYNWIASDPDHAGTQEYTLSTVVKGPTTSETNRDGLPMSIISSVPTENTDAARQKKTEKELAYNFKPGGVENTSHSFTRVVFSSLPNMEASSLSFNIAVGKNAPSTQKMKVTVCIADSGMAYSRYVVVTDELPEKSVHITTPLHSYGYMKQLEITVETPTEGVKISVDDIVVNAQIAFSFSWLRFFGIWLALLSLYALRPGSAVWRCRYKEHPLLAIIPSVIFVAIAASFFIWETSVPQDHWNSEVPGASDEYATLAQAMVDSGHLYLDTIPPDYMQDMKDLDDGDERLAGKENIYDPSARKYMQSNAGSPTTYKLDAAYYDGRYYVYFGVAPVILAYIPYYMITGEYLGNTPVVFVCLLIIAIFAFLLLDFLVRRKFCDASCGVVIVSYIGLLVASCLVYSITYPAFYNVPVCFALALLSIGTYLLFRAYETDKAWRRHILVLFGVLCLITTLGCRPQITIGAFIIGLFYLVLSIRKRRVSSLDVTAALFPIALVIGLLLLYNYARFGSPLDFGANYNLTGNDMTLRGHSLIRGLEGLIWYMFGLPELSVNYPFMERYMPDCVYAGRSVSEHFTCGLLFNAPFVLLAFVFAVSQKVPRFIRVSIIMCIAATFGMALFDSEGAGIVIRYTQDFGYLIGAAFVLGLVSYDHIGADGRDWGFSVDGAERMLTGNFAPIVTRQNVDGSGAWARMPRYHSIYSVAVLLLGASLIICLFIWTAQAADYLPLTYAFDYYDVKSVFDVWGPTAIPIGN